jgi:hypothetical protein
MDVKRRLLGARFRMALGIPLILLVAGILLALASDSLSVMLKFDLHLLIPIGIGMVSFALIVILVGAGIQALIVRAMLRAVYRSLKRSSATERIRVVDIENPLTSSRVKVLVDDKALLYCDASRRLIIVEGVFHRYAIHAPDVISCTHRRNFPTSYVFVTYRVASSPIIFSLGLSYVSVVTQLKVVASLGFARSPLARLIRRTLGIPIPYYPPDFSDAPLSTSVK